MSDVLGVQIDRVDDAMMELEMDGLEYSPQWDVLWDVREMLEEANGRSYRPVDVTLHLTPWENDTTPFNSSGWDGR